MGRWHKVWEYSVMETAEKSTYSKVRLGIRKKNLHWDSVCPQFKEVAIPSQSNQAGGVPSYSFLSSLGLRKAVSRTPLEISADTCRLAESSHSIPCRWKVQWSFPCLGALLLLLRTYLLIGNHGKHFHFGTWLQSPRTWLAIDQPCREPGNSHRCPPEARHNVLNLSTVSNKSRTGGECCLVGAQWFLLWS